MNFNFELVRDWMPYFLSGMMWTIVMTVGGILIGMVLGLFIGLGKLLENIFLRLPFIWYINLFRGTPFLVQIFILHFGVMPIVMNSPNVIVTGIVALSLNSAAYIAEIFRAGIQSIDKGQMEAARSLGMTHWQAMKEIILPQAYKRMIPPLGNEFIVLLKESSLLAIIAAPELMYWGRAMQGATYRVWEPYLTVALVYLVLTLSLTYFVDYLERRYKTE
ncbi:amino acid ABC transporter permease [Bacillus alkalicellulosilyticus]|uniref:amino acid ABC transporter permease n=1 Tax=Alkalihalobacterium alkalicellulosilyticum TaxID=1912214 RepID=UPI000997C4E0|nr:amino acid ABC transporter permease [Bacillus alkalicellulosilyticus]